LTSTVSFTSPSELSVSTFEAFAELASDRIVILPPSYLSGAPKVWAIRFIEKMEKGSRAWYGGAVGLIGEYAADTLFDSVI
jgi:anthranilate/para-aminobenzoate synthase component I